MLRIFTGGFFRTGSQIRGGGEEQVMFPLNTELYLSSYFRLRKIGDFAMMIEEVGT